MRTPRLQSIQVGLPCPYGSETAAEPDDKFWTTGFYKEPVDGLIFAGETNLMGDGQADLVNHGGPDKAICVYSADHYAYWRDRLENPALPTGAFGENFTLEAVSESEICIGDIWKVGTVTVQVSQPRQPCWKLARRWRVKTLALEVQQTGYTGWYFRVLQEGVVAPGSTLSLIERIHPDWTVERANQVMYHEKENRDLAAELGALPTLSESWKDSMASRIAKLKSV